MPEALNLSLEQIQFRMELEAKLKAISRSQAVIEFDMGGAVIAANEQFLSAFGYEADEVIGRHHCMFVEPGVQKSRSYAEFWERLRRGEYSSGEYKRLGKGGREVWIQATYNPIFDIQGKPFKVIKYAVDVTAQKLRNADYSGQIAAISQSHAVIEFDLAGHIISANENFLKITGYALQEIIGVHHRIFVDAEEVGSPEYEIFWGDLRTGLHRAGQYRRRAKDGRQVWLQASYNPILDLNGRPFKIVKYATDVTEAIEREALALRLEAERQVAEASAAAKSAFMATMSHELRTPLTSILGFSRLLGGSDGLSAADQERVNLIRSAGETLLQVVNDILDFSKLESGGMVLSPVSFSLRTMMEGLTALLRQQAEDKGIDLVCKVDVEAVLLADTSRLRQILLNLVGNAVKFTERGSVTVESRLSPARDGMHRLRIEVSDTGIGIPPDLQDKLFRRFSQVDGAISRRFGGTGLGLAISRELIELMEGEIGVQSDGRSGSLFWIEIPVPAVPEVEEHAAPTDTVRLDRKLRLLMADDHLANHILVKALLEPFDIEVASVQNGEEAVKAASEASYDLILMDMQMPVMDGLAATAALRARGDTTPIVALSANILPDQVERCIAAGMQGHAAKPIDPAQLIAAIEAHTRPPDLQAAA